MNLTKRDLSPEQKHLIFIKKMDVRKKFRDSRNEVKLFTESDYYLKNITSSLEKEYFNCYLNVRELDSTKVSSEIFDYYMEVLKMKVIVDYHKEIKEMSLEDYEILSKFSIYLTYELIFDYEWTRKFERELLEGKIDY